MRRLVWLLLLPALALRVLVPPGFMPATGDGHGLAMQMCHGAGPLPAPTSPEGPGGAPAHDSPCVFAAAGTVAPPPADVHLQEGAVQPPLYLADPALILFHREPPRANGARAPPGSLHLA